MTAPDGHAIDLDGPRAQTHDGPLSLVVIADSTAFTDHLGPQLPHTPHLYPQVAARALADALDRDVVATVVARPGTTVRDAVRTVTKDQHVQFDLLASADAVVVGVGSFDHAPAGVPPSIEALATHLRPARLRRRVRRGLRASYPWLARTVGRHRSRTPVTEFDRLFAQLLDHVRGLTWGRVAGVALGPTSHRSRYYGGAHRIHAAREAHHLAVARAHGFATVATWPLVAPHADALNVDGIHWPPAAHDAVGRAVAATLLPALSGTAPTVGLPPAVEAAIRGGPGGTRAPVEGG